MVAAETWTSLVLGTLQDAADTFTRHGDSEPVRMIASIVGQEGEQNGFYRSLLRRVPSEKPFLTTSLGSFAFSALQQFIVSCPFNVSDIPISTFPLLHVVSGDGGVDVQGFDQNLAFTTDLTGVVADVEAYASGSGLYVTYLTGQDLPITEPITNASWSGNWLTFNAFFPFTEYVMDGLSIAALTTSPNFTSLDDVPGSTLAAPGLVQVNTRFF